MTPLINLMQKQERSKSKLSNPHDSSNAVQSAVMKYLTLSHLFIYRKKQIHLLSHVWICVHSCCRVCLFSYLAVGHLWSAQSCVQYICISAKAQPHNQLIVCNHRGLHHHRTSVLLGCTRVTHATSCALWGVFTWVSLTRLKKSNFSMLLLNPYFFYICASSKTRGGWANDIVVSVCLFVTHRKPRVLAGCGQWATWRAGTRAKDCHWQTPGTELFRNSWCCRHRHRQSQRWAHPPSAPPHFRICNLELVLS